MVKSEKTNWASSRTPPMSLRSIEQVEIVGVHIGKKNVQYIKKKKEKKNPKASVDESRIEYKAKKTTTCREGKVKRLVTMPPFDSHLQIRSRPITKTLNGLIYPSKLGL